MASGLLLMRAMAEAQQTLPDPDVCRTKAISNETAMFCLIKDPLSCPHVKALSGFNFCWHPDRKKFAKVKPNLPKRRNTSDGEAGS